MFFTCATYTDLSFLSASLRAVLLTSRRKKSFVLFFAHEKGLGRMFQKQFSCSPILFFCVSTSQK